MPSHRTAVSAIAVAIALAVSQTSFGGQVGLDYYSVTNITPAVPSILPNFNFANSLTPSFTWVNSSGMVVGTVYANTGSISDGKVVYLTNSNTGQTSYIGFEPANSQDYGYQTNAAVSAVTSLANGTSALNTINSVGDVIGTVGRYYTQVSIGTDAWVYIAGSTSNTTIPNGSGLLSVLTPTRVNLVGAVTDVGGTTTTYSWANAAASNELSEFGSPTGVNASGQVAGTSTRYANATSNSNVGTDIFLTSTSTTSGSTTVTQKVVLGLGANNSAAGYSYSSNGVINRTSSMIVNTNSLNAPGLVGINDNGEVAGMTSRYGFTSSSTGAGTDAWVYTGSGNATVSATYQIGLIGSDLTAGHYQFESSPANLAASVNSATSVFTTYRNSSLTQLNAAGQIGGTSAYYAVGNTTSTSTSALGTVAWIYTPSGTPATNSTGISAGTTPSTNGYRLVGLYNSVAGTAGTGTFGSPTVAGYVSSTGASGSLIVGLSNDGHAAGTSTRYVNTLVGNIGKDAWYSDGTSTKIISPNTQTPGSNTGLITKSYVGGTLVATQTYSVSGVSSLSGTLASNYYQTASNSSNGNYNVNVSAMSPSGRYVSGTISRINSGTGGLGSDAFVYDSETNTDYVIVVPLPTGTTLASNFENISAQSVSNDGIVAGVYTQYTGTTSTNPVGTFLYEWSLANGFVTLDRLYAGLATTTQTTQTPTDALADQSGFAFLSATSGGVLPFDSNNNIYVGGVLPTASSFNASNGVFKIAGTPSIFWLGGLDNWSNAAKWSTGVVPNNPSLLVALDGGNATASAITLDQNVSIATAILDANDSLTIASGNTLTLNGPTTSLFSGVLTNAGQLAIAGGTTQLLSSATHTGAFTVASGAILDFHGGTHILTSASSIIASGVVKITGTAVVSAAGSLTVAATGGLSVGSGATFNSTGTLTMAAGLTNAGTTTISGVQSWSPGTTFTNTAGTATLQSDAGSFSTRTLTLAVNGGTVNLEGVQHLQGITMGGGVLNVDGDVILATGSYATLATALTMHTITTSSAVTGTSVALLTGAQFLSLSATGQRHGQTVGSSDLILSYTYAGDANLDGIISIDDYLQIDSEYLAGGSGATWFTGDFNYDGTVNFQDYALIDAAAAAQGSPLATAEISEHLAKFGSEYQTALAAAQTTAVPEPGTLALAAFGGLGLLARKPRHRKTARTL